MNAEKLDALLRNLSDSEKGYRNGTKKSIWEEYLKTGKEIPRIGMLEDSTMPKSYRSRNSTFHVIIPELNISVNKNSRFCPVPTHTHEFVEISYVYSGSCPEIIDNTSFTLTKGQILMVDTNCPHSVGRLSEDDILINLLISHDYLYKNLFSHISGNGILSEFFVNALTERAEHDHYLYFRSENSSRIPLFFNELLCECCDPSINSADIINNLIGLIFAELMNVYESNLAKTEIAANSISVIPIIHYIEANFRTCSRESVANIFHISEKHLTSILKRDTGLTFKQLLQSQKLKYAARLLRNTSLPIADIIADCGYENASFFYRKFQDEYGMSPKEFREKSI